MHGLSGVSIISMTLTTYVNSYFHFSKIASIVSQSDCKIIFDTNNDFEGSHCVMNGMCKISPYNSFETFSTWETLLHVSIVP